VSNSGSPAWRLIAYDIRDRRRLQRLRYRLQREATYLQKSVALVKLNDAQLDGLLKRLSPLLAADDDFRVYRLASLSDISLAGLDKLPGTSLGQPAIIKIDIQASNH